MKLRKGLRMNAANAAEPFDYFDGDGNRIGTTGRETVHRQGLWHRSTHVFVFNSRRDLLIQKRAADKDLYPGLWDYSVGEHLQPGETHAQAAQRGLMEELHIGPLEVQPIGPERRVEWLGENYADREIQQAYTAAFDGAVRVDPGEVQFCWYISLPVLSRWITLRPDDFTPGLVADLGAFGWL